MIAEADDFLAETQALATLIAPLTERDYQERTQFKDWAINAVLQHLHTWNRAAHLSLTDAAGFAAFVDRVRGGGGLRAFEEAWLSGLSGIALRDAWLAHAGETASAFRKADPKARLKWMGPDMSARSSITARQMETWAHGQEVFDLLGVERVETDRVRNIAHLGVSTFGWTFAARGRKPPGEAPHVRLTAPSGAVWEWNTPSSEDYVSGDAVEFCRVVTQTRSIADTRLTVKGPVATEWMSIAQCFAGAASEPPAPGTRFTQQR